MWWPCTSLPNPARNLRLLRHFFISQGLHDCDSDTLRTDSIVISYRIQFVSRYLAQISMSYWFLICVFSKISTNWILYDKARTIVVLCGIGSILQTRSYWNTNHLIPPSSIVIDVKFDDSSNQSWRSLQSCEGQWRRGKGKGWRWWQYSERNVLPDPSVWIKIELNRGKMNIPSKICKIDFKGCARLMVIVMIYICCLRWCIKCIHNRHW